MKNTYNDKNSRSQANHRNKEELAKKVERGTKKAIKDYGEVFRRLAEYDKT